MVDVIIPISTAGRAAVPIHMTIIDVIVGRVESQIDVIWGGIALPASFTGPLIAAAIAHMGGGGTALPTV
jgi:hypothetical protein